MGEKKHIHKIPPKSWDNPVNILFTCFFFTCFSSLPNTGNITFSPPIFSRNGLGVKNGRGGREQVFF